MPDGIRNFDLEVRNVFKLAKGLEDVSEIFSTTPIAFSEADDAAWFWRQIEEQFDAPITKAEKQNLRNVGQLIHYLKIRAKFVRRTA